MRRPRILLATLFLSVSIWLLYSFRGSPPPDFLKGRHGFYRGSSNIDKHADVSKSNSFGLDNISSTAKVATMHLEAVFANVTAPLSHDLGVAIPHFFPIDSLDGSAYLDPSSLPIKVRVPARPNRPDASGLMFGVATTLDRLNESLDAFSHWASGTNTTFIVIISPKDDTKGFTVDGLYQKAKTLSIGLRIVEQDAEFMDRYVLLLQVLHEHKTPRIKWFGIIDDDTFFPSMERLLQMLAKYDANQPFYIGGVTEDFETIERWGYLGFGGAGIFLSSPLLTTIQPHFTTCFQLPITSGGDGRLAECIYRFTTTKFTWDHGLHQLDMHGDYSGFFEAVRPVPVSVHHWKSWGQHDIVLVSKIARLCGESCVLQKFQLAAGWYMTNGFSIVKYSSGGSSGDEREQETLPPSPPLSHSEGSMERTWDVIAGETHRTFMHSLEPLRPKDHGKLSYRLEAAVEDDDDDNNSAKNKKQRQMTLYYVKRGDALVKGDGRGIGEAIIRVVWSTKS